MTDVQFVAGKESFYAHRSILSARSPVLAAMFTSGMKECLIGQVLIDDVEPSTFRHFMEFVYTGQQGLRGKSSLLLPINIKLKL